MLTVSPSPSSSKVFVNTTVGQCESCFQNGGNMAPRSVRRLLNLFPSHTSKSPGYHIHVACVLIS